MFKADWEKASSAHKLPEGMVEKMILLAYPDKKLVSYELIAGGCSNLNIKILLEHEKHYQLLRVYLRDPNAAYREQKLGEMLKQTVPAPLTYYIGKVDDYQFAVTEFLLGISLSDLLLSNIPHDVNAIMYEVGASLSSIAMHKFSISGEFDKDLNIIPYSLPDDYLIFVRDCLKHKTVLSELTPKTISRINQVINQFGHLFPNGKETHLVHADFDPANILVHQVNDIWKVSGILDWEFAFSGSILHDIANMLRYAHKMPSEFQDFFLKCLTDNGIVLPENWRTTVNLLNLFSLLDCLKRSSPKTHPNQCADIRELIDHIL